MRAGVDSWHSSVSRVLGAIDYEEVTIDNSLTPLSPLKAAAAEFGCLRVSGGSIRALWYPGASGSLSTSFGVQFIDGDWCWLNRRELLDWLAIAEGVPDGKLHVHYYA